MGSFELCGLCDYDPDLPVSALSWHRLQQLGCSTEQRASTRVVHFPPTPVTLTAKWVGGALAGDMTPLTKLLEIHADPTVLASWAGRQSGAPSSALPELKPVKHVPSDEAHRLGRVHRAQVQLPAL